MATLPPPPTHYATTLFEIDPGVNTALYVDDVQHFLGPRFIGGIIYLRRYYSLLLQYR